MKEDEKLKFEYQVGGSLGVNAPSYAIRKADRELYENLKAGNFCYVLNTRQIGKSSLRVRAIEKLRQEGFACAAIDLSIIGSSSSMAEQWYKAIAVELWRNFNLKTNFKLFWQQQSEFSPLQALRIFIEEVLFIEVAEEKIFIAIDEIDSILTLQFPSDDFFTFIRYCWQKRSEYKNYERLTFAIFGVANPSDLIVDLQRTPFNIGKAIELEDFSLEESLILASGLKDLVNNPESWLALIWEWTKGQPFLTQKICQLLVNLASTQTDILKTIELERVKSWLENFLRENLIDSWQSQDDPPHLRTIEARILREKEQTAQILNLYQKIRDEKAIAIDNSKEQQELLLSGAIAIRNKLVSVRNPIYEEVFNNEWIQRQIELLRPYASALNDWLKSKFQDDSRLLRGEALKEAQLWAKDKKLNVLDYQFLSASEELDRQQEQIALETARLQAVEARVEQECRNFKLQNFLLITINIAFLISTTLGLITFSEYERAQVRELEALTTSAEALFLSNRPLEAIVQAFEAKEKSQKIAKVPFQLQEKTDLVLSRTIFGANLANSLSGHTQAVSGLAFNPEGSILASASLDRTIRLWTPSGHLLQVLKGHNDRVYNVTFHPHKDLLASASADRTIKLWKTDGTLLNTFSGHKDLVWSVAFSPDGQTLASASFDGTVKIWRLDGYLLKTLKHSEAPVFAVAWSPDGNLLATGSADRTIKFWNKNGVPIQTINAHDAEIVSLAWSPNGEKLVSGSWDRCVKLWSRNGNFLKILGKHEDNVWGVTWSQDGTRIASSSFDRKIKIWQDNGDSIDELILGKENKGTRQVIFGKERTLLVSGNEDGKINFWNLNNDLALVIGGNNGNINSLSVSSDGQTFVSGNKNGKINVWSDRGKTLKTIQAYSLNTAKVAFNPKFPEFASFGNDNLIKSWTPDGRLIKQIKAPFFEFNPLSWSPDGQFLAIGAGLQQIHFHYPNFQIVNKIPEKFIFELNLSPDGTIIAVGDIEGQIKLKKVNGDLIQSLRAHKASVRSIGWSPDSQIFVSSGHDFLLKIWQRDGTLLKEINLHNFNAIDIVFHPEGKIFATAGDDSNILIWNLQGTLLAKLNAHVLSVNTLVFTPDGKKLLSGGADGKTILWDFPQAIQPDRVFAYGCAWIKDYLENNTELTSAQKKLCQHSFHS